MRDKALRHTKHIYMKGLDAMNAKRFVRLTTDVVYYCLGSLLFAASVNIFTAPNDIAPGGVTGLAILAQALFGAHIGLTTIALNIPIFIWGVYSLGWRDMGKTAAAILLTSIAIDATDGLFPVYRGDPMLICVFGGIAAGAGLSLIFMRGGTTGGTDLAAHLLARKLRFLSLGKLILLIDLPILVLSGVVYDSWESPLYALIVIFITTKVIDTMLHGISESTGKLMLIISPRHEEIRQDILHSLPRGVTELWGRGSYTGRNSTVLMVAVRRPEVYRVYDMVYRLDRDAFIIVTEVSEILGEGFRPKRKMPK